MKQTITRRRAISFIILAAAASTIAACNGQNASTGPEVKAESPRTAEPEAATSTASAVPEQNPTASPTEVARQATIVAVESTPTGTQATTTSEPKSKDDAEPTPVVPEVQLVPLSDDEKGRADRWNSSGWKTDFSRKTIDLRDVKSGGPPRDGIPPIRDPRFMTMAEGDEFFDDREPVIAVELNGQARAYPLQILTWHEIVNDVVGGEPVIVTFCPLCNTALTFSRTVGDRTFSFGTSGNLRASNLIMWDRETESWWQQATGNAIAGEMVGSRLTFLPSAIVSWAVFKATFPDADVLSRDTGFRRSYGSNPYSGYDTTEGSPFLFDGELDDRLRPIDRVVTVTVGDGDVAYPYTELEVQKVIHDTVGGKDIVVFWAAGTVSALDRGTISQSRDIGGTGVFFPVLDGVRLTFSSRDDGIFDEETGSEWNVLGLAVSGPNEGKRLEPVVHADHLWFSWAAFKPDTRIFRAG